MCQGLLLCVDCVSVCLFVCLCDWVICCYCCFVCVMWLVRSGLIVWQSFCSCVRVSIASGSATGGAVGAAGAASRAGASRGWAYIISYQTTRHYVTLWIILCYRIIILLDYNQSHCIMLDHTVVYHVYAHPLDRPRPRLQRGGGCRPAGAAGGRGAYCALI